MERIHSVLSVSISEFKQNPGEVIEVWRGEPAAVLNRNRPAFYTVFPEFMAEMGELYDERQLTNLVRSPEVRETRGQGRHRRFVTAYELLFVPEAREEWAELHGPLEALFKQALRKRLKGTARAGLKLRGVGYRLVYIARDDENSAECRRFNGWPSRWRNHEAAAAGGAWAESLTRHVSRHLNTTH